MNGIMWSGKLVMSPATKYQSLKYPESCREMNQNLPTLYLFILMIWNLKKLNPIILKDGQSGPDEYHSVIQGINQDLKKVQ